MSSITFCPARLSGSAAVPPAKSEAHRALLLAALGHGECCLNGFSTPLCDDTLAMIDGVRALGAGVCVRDGALHVSQLPVLPYHGQSYHAVQARQHAFVSFPQAYRYVARSGQARCKQCLPKPEFETKACHFFDRSSGKFNRPEAHAGHWLRRMRHFVFPASSK